MAARNIRNTRSSRSTRSTLDARNGRQVPVTTSFTMPSDEEMIAAANDFSYNPIPSGKGGIRTGFAFPRDNPVVYLKRPNARGEAEMHRFAYDHLQALPLEMRQNIRIPRLYKFIDSRPRYMVMEFVRGRTMEQILETNEGQPPDTALVDHLHDLAAKAISLLLKFNVPPDTPPGQGNGGQNPIRHVIYADFQSFYKYTSVAVMDEHYNKACLKSSPNSRLLARTYPDGVIPPGHDRFEFAKERMCFCYSDIATRNFMVADAAPQCLYLIDFDMCSFLPQPFFAYVLTRGNFGFLRSLYERIEPNEEGLDGRTTAIALLKQIPGLIKLAIHVSPTAGVTTNESGL